MPRWIALSIGGRLEEPLLGAVRMTYQELLQIVELIKASARFTEFHLKCGDIEVDIRRSPEAPPVPVVPSTRAPVAVSGTQAGPVTSSVPAPPSTRSTVAEGYPEGAVVITAPMVGTFYRAPEPGAPPFVEIGQQVQPESIVCIIEVMKLMNSIPAGCQGTVLQIGPHDGEPVQFGQVLLVIEPH